MHFPRLKAIGEAATKGPWDLCDGVPGAVTHIDHEIGRPINLFTEDFEGYYITSHRPDARFIAVSRNVYDKLLAVAEVAQTIARIMPTPAGPNGLGARLREALAALREFEEKLP